MGLEQTVSRRNVLRLGIISLGGLVLARCGGDATVNVPDEFDLKHVGAVKGVLTVARIRNNRVVYEPQGNMLVRIDETKFSTRTGSDGTYFIDNIPTGRYDVLANDLPDSDPQHHVKEALTGYHTGSGSATIEKQITNKGPDFSLDPDGSKVPQTSILYGRAWGKNGEAYAGRKIAMIDEYPVREIASTITSSDGSFAFYNPFAYVSGIRTNLRIESQEGPLILAGQNNSGADYVQIIKGLVHKDLRLS